MIIPHLLTMVRPLLVVLAAVCGGLGVAAISSTVDFSFSPHSPGSILSAYGSDHSDTFVERRGRPPSSPARHQRSGGHARPSPVAQARRKRTLCRGCGRSVRSAADRRHCERRPAGDPGPAGCGISWRSLPIRGVALPRQQSAPEGTGRTAGYLGAPGSGDLAGKPADAALQSVAEFGGPLANLIREAVDLSARTARPLIGRGDGTPGLLARWPAL